MARYVGPVCRLCRRQGSKLFLKGERCFTTKCALEKRNYPPGQHGQQRKKISNYGVQLREKQKLRRIYGLNEQQFRNYFSKAVAQRGVSGDNFLRLLERRLDNVVFRLGLTDSRSQARQLVRHGHVIVNGHKVNIPSYSIAIGETVAVKEKTKGKAFLQDAVETAKNKKVPVWLEMDYDKVQGKVVSFPAREDIDTQVDELLVVEFYSR